MTKLAEQEVVETVEEETPESQDPNTVATCALVFDRLQERIKKSDAHSLNIPASALMLAQGEGSFEVEPASDDKTKPRRWKMTANSGKVISHPFWGKFAVDMSGMKVGRQKKPVHEDHKTELKVGFSDTITIDKKNRVLAGGAFLMNDPHAQKVMSNADDGYPFEASIFPFPDEIEFVGYGETALVNGMKMKGPGAILRKSRLRELSFCGLGADENTSSTALSGSELEVSITGTMLTNEEEEVETMAQEQKTEATQIPEGMVKLSDLTVDKLRADAPAVAEALVKEGRETALSEEATRRDGIFEAAYSDGCKLDMTDQIKTALSEGKTIDKACADFGKFKLSEFQKTGAPAVGGNEEHTALDDVDAEKTNQVKLSSDDLEVRMKAHIALSAAYRKEHGCSLTDAMRATALTRK